ncbi:hypothetical protein, partial [Loktanella sp. S4079]|uniref:hypothetical protein n=1 Tax=Loktanella sp. S4079 TaxID=579483 RepID=UPI000B0EF5A9
MNCQMPSPSEMTTPTSVWSPDQWLSWGNINDPVQADQIRLHFPDTDPVYIATLQGLLRTARVFNASTNRHLQIYGDIGELYGAIVHGIALHRFSAEGSDGRLGNDFVEIKTISPFKKRKLVNLRMDRHFSKLLAVRVMQDFSVQGVMVSRSALPKP